MSHRRKAERERKFYYSIFVHEFFFYLVHTEEDEKKYKEIIESQSDIFPHFYIVIPLKIKIVRRETIFVIKTRHYFSHCMYA